jgi:hypothetical protein
MNKVMRQWFQVKRVGNLSLKGCVGDSRLCPCVRTAIGGASRGTLRFPAVHRGMSAIADVMFRAKHHLPLAKHRLT